MTIERTIDIDGTEYPLVLSDEPQTLLTAKAAGRVVVGLGDCPSADADLSACGDPSADADPSVCCDSGKDTPADGNLPDGYTKASSKKWLPADYVAAGLPVGEVWLEGVARRELGIPWKIAETDRLMIREFSVEDCHLIPDDDGDSPDEAILKDPKRLQAYIEEQYAFFDCGMWALVSKNDGNIIGMLSLTPASDDTAGPDIQVCELGCHIYSPYRKCGYAAEAFSGILKLLSERKIYAIAHVESDNTASLALLKSLGFEQVSSDCFLHPDFV